MPTAAQEHIAQNKDNLLKQACVVVCAVNLGRREHILDTVNNNY